MRIDKNKKEMMEDFLQNSYFSDKEKRAQMFEEFSVSVEDISKEQEKMVIDKKMDQFAKNKVDFEEFIEENKEELKDSIKSFKKEKRKANNEKTRSNIRKDMLIKFGTSLIEEENDDLTKSSVDSLIKIKDTCRKIDFYKRNKQIKKLGKININNISQLTKKSFAKQSARATLEATKATAKATAQTAKAVISAVVKAGSSLATVLASIGGGMALIIMIIVVCFGSILFTLFGGNSILEQQEGGGSYGIVGINAETLQYKELVEKKCAEKGLSNYVNVVLAIIMQESAGNASVDLMRSAESIGLPAGSLTNPEASIEAGLNHLKSCIDTAHGKGIEDIQVILQGYNMGCGVINYISTHGGVYTRQVCVEFAFSQSPSGRYGDVDYAPHVMRYLNVLENGGSAASGTLTIINTSGWNERDVNNVNSVQLTDLTSYACSFITNKYVYGGNDINNGIDCSGFVQQVFSHFGVVLPRSSDQQATVGTEINGLENAQAGDIICYSGHVGIYLGNNLIVNASNSDPYPAGGIKTQPANYREILTIRRVR